MPPRNLTDEELESVRLTELAEAPTRDPRVAAGRTYLQANDGQLKLYCPRHETCSFGPGDARGGTTDRLIQFGEAEAHVAIVSAMHPLLADLRKRKPYVVVLEPGEQPGRIYTCEDCDKEFATKRELKAHRAGGHRKAPPVRVAKDRPVKDEAALLEDLEE